MSMVIPCSCSPFSLSKTQAFLKEPITFVDLMASSGGLGRIYVSNDHDVDESFPFPFWLHFSGGFSKHLHSDCKPIAKKA
jgi:hypothetical protein